MARIIVYEGREFPDPDSKMTNEEVRQYLSTYFPELSNAEAKETKRGEDTVITLTKRVGTKGAKVTPSQCKLERCSYNAIAPGELSQECLFCEGLAHPILFKRAFEAKQAKYKAAHVG